MEKICVFHNLPPGGGRKYVYKISQILSKKHELTLYTHQEHLTKYELKPFKNVVVIPFAISKNIFIQNIQIKNDLNKLAKKMACEINNNFDLVLVHPCTYTQTPHLLKHIKEPKVYFFQETKREFYEKTTFDYWDPKRAIARLIRMPIKHIDRTNIKNTKTIITNSQYSSYILKKIYKKNSFILQPVRTIKKTTNKTLKSKTIISVGAINYLKGHHFSTKILKRSPYSLVIIGNGTEANYPQNTNNQISFKENVTNDQLEKHLRNSSIFLANQINEPMGIATIEAISHFIYIIGFNLAGTSEIAKHGLNGHLVPAKNYINQRKKIDNLLKQEKVKLLINTTEDWSSLVNRLLTIIEDEHNIS
jgi:glycosyltransferase involved in cell wall biosynthesis